MPTQYIVRRPAAAPAKSRAGAAVVYVDSDTNQLKVVGGGEGATTEVTVGASVPSIQLTATTVTVAAATDANKVYIQTLGSGTQTYTLPLAAAAPGQVNTFICGDAASEILINTGTGDQLSIKGLVDHSTSVKPTTGTGIKNTAATNVLGDYLTLVSDGVATWHEVSGAGIWASQ